MTSKKEPTPAAAPEQPVKKRPTPAQLATIHSGGDYVFDPDTGAFEQKRKPAQPAAPKGGN